MSEADRPNEDPRELARKLAEQAKARTAPQPAAEDPRELARRLADQAKARVTPAPAPEPAKRSLADRASKPLSPQEALRRAIEEEEKEASSRKVLVTRATLKPGVAPVNTRPAAPPMAAPAAPQPAAQPAPQPAAQAAPQAVIVRDPTTVLAERLPTATVVRALPVSNRVVFQALWQAHRARAAVEGDLALLVAADALVDAAGRVPDGALFAVEVLWLGEPWAIWIDAARGAPLAAARQPALLLAGL